MAKGASPHSNREQRTAEPVGEEQALWVGRREGRRAAAGCCWFSHTLPLYPELHTNRGFLLHAGLLHAEGDLGVLVAEKNICYTRGWVARAQMLAVSQVHVFMA